MSVCLSYEPCCIRTCTHTQRSKMRNSGNTLMSPTPDVKFGSGRSPIKRKMVTHTAIAAFTAQEQKKLQSQGYIINMSAWRSLNVTEDKKMANAKRCAINSKVKCRTKGGEMHCVSLSIILTNRILNTHCKNYKNTHTKQLNTTSTIRTKLHCLVMEAAYRWEQNDLFNASTVL